jgi:phenylacetate-CoA ligase
VSPVAAGAISSVAALVAAGWSGDRLRRYRDARLRALVRHAAHDVPLYRRRFAEAGVDPRSFRGLDDLDELPLLTRDDLQHHVDELFAPSVARRALRVYRTSGSSGAPIEIRRTTFEDTLLRLLRLQSEIAHGYRPWRRSFGLARPSGRPPSIWNQFGLLRRETVDCRLPVAEIVARLLASRPPAVAGFAGSVAAVAAALDEPARRRLDVRFVRTAAEVLTPAMRAAITAAFGCPVHDFYASHEVNLIAADCPRGAGLKHVLESSVVVEVLRDGAPAAVGENGEIVITGLHSFAMPFLRYRLGDLVVRGPDRCPCGAPCATLGAIEGRVIEPFRVAGGQRLHPYTLTTILVQQLRGIERYQIVQEAGDLLRVRVVTLDRAPLADAGAIRARLAAACPPGVRLELEQVAEIPPDSSGKHRPFVIRAAAQDEPGSAFAR